MSASAFNLLREQWIPAFRRHSGLCNIRPAEITSNQDDPVLAIAWPRPDFRAAALEFLIGLLSTAAPPREEEDWEQGWHEPPPLEVLDAAFAPIADAFDLDGDGPRFLQDLELFVSEPTSPTNLLIDAPGENAVKNNTDLLVKRGGQSVLSRSAAAMALFTLQTYAPSGGAGHRTGFRGGGPLTTLVMPDSPDEQPRTLWHLVWANVEAGQPLPETDLADVFPWLAPTLTSERGGLGPRRLNDRNRLQYFWTMPRRIRLDFASNSASVPCAVTGVVEPVVITGWRSRPYGVQYETSGWTHPLTPHYRQKMTEPWLPVHGQPGGVGYRQWAALALSDGTRTAADAVRRFREDRAPLLGANGRRVRLLAAGYDMDNAKARGFVEAEMPLPTLADANARQALDNCARQLVGAAVLVADLLRSALRLALFGPASKTDPSSTVLQAARDAFWTATEGRFYALLDSMAEQLAADPARDLDSLMLEWRAVLQHAALEGFDAAAPLDPDAYRFRNSAQQGSAQAVVSARRILGATLAGYGKIGVEFFTALGVAPPEKSAARRKSRTRGKAP